MSSNYDKVRRMDLQDIPLPSYPPTEQTGSTASEPLRQSLVRVLCQCKERA
jgi:hypothetical protein